MPAVVNASNARAHGTANGPPDESNGGRPRFTSPDETGANPADAPTRSPDILAAPSTRGRGVRRLNRRPLIVVFAVVGAVLLAFLYTVQQRIAFRRRMAQQNPPASEAGTTPIPSQPPVLANAPSGGVIPAAGDVADNPTAAAGGEVALGADAVAAAGAGFDPNYGSSTGQAGGSAGAPGTAGFGDDGVRRVRVGLGPVVDPVFGGDTAARAQAWRAYREEVTEIRHARQQAENQALAAGPTVDFRGRGGSGASGGAGLSSAAANGNGAVQASAQDPDLRALLALVQGDNRGAPATSSVYGTGPRTAAPGGDGVTAGPDGGTGTGIGAALSGIADGRGGTGQSGAAAGGSGALGAARGPSRVDERSPYTLTAGTVIPAVLVAGMNSDLPGQVLAQVSENVYDGATGARVLVPQGAKLLGTYNASVTTGQQRVFAVWNRVLFPDGSTLELGDMPGADRAGAAGFRDRVDNHYGQTFGSAILMSLFGAGVQLSQPQQRGGLYPSNGQIVAGALGQQTGELGMEVARRGLQIPPRLQIRPGYRFNVMVTRDLALRAWGRP